MNTKNNGTTAIKVKNMTKAFVAYTLGAEPTWVPGTKTTFKFVFSNCNSTWEMTLTRESDNYTPYKYRLDGKQLTFEGRTPEHPASWCRRYITMDRAFLHILNHFNANAYIRDRYSNVWQWLENSGSDESLI